MVRPKRHIKPPSNLKEYFVMSETEKELEKFDANPSLPSSDTNIYRSQKVIALNCKLCNKKFINCDEYSSHVKSHKEKTYLCEDCGKCFSSLQALNEHLNIHHNTKPFKCDICGKQSRHQSVHSRHLDKHQSKTQRFKCPKCNETFKQNIYLKHHMRKHDGVKPYNCSYCSKSFSVKTELNRHLLSHSSQRPFVCSFCLKRFKMRHHLTAHIKRHTNRVNQWKCMHCRGCFSSQSLYKDHTKLHSESIVLLKLFKKDSRNIMVTTSSGDRRRVPSFQPITLPENVSLDDQESLRKSHLSLSVNDVLIPIEVVSKSFGTGDNISMKIIDRFDNPAEPPELKEGDVKISLVTETAKKSQEEEENLEGEVNEDQEEKEVSSSSNFDPISKKSPIKLCISLASDIEKCGFKEHAIDQVLPSIKHFAKIISGLPQPLPLQVCLQSSSIIHKLQQFLISLTCNSSSDKDQLSNSNEETKKSHEDLKSTLNMINNEEIKALHSCYASLLDVLQQHFKFSFKEFIS